MKYDEHSLKDIVALVTGGGRGLGRAFALALAEVGAKVAVVARSERQVAQTAKLISEAGGRSCGLAADVSERRDVESAVAHIQSQLGPIDLLVNNAAVMSPLRPDWEVDPEQWWRTVEINLRGPYLCSRAVLPAMVSRGRGRIINISSGAAFFPRPYNSAYGVSKAAVTHMTNCLAAATAQYGISVLAYGPGFVRTEMTKYMAESPESQKYEGARFRQRFADGLDTPIERTVEVFMAVASGKLDALSGRYIDVNDDVQELAKRAEEIMQGDLYTLRRRVL